MSSALIKVDVVSKRFGEQRALDDVSLEIERGEIFALLGPSGCGKTTLLRILAGLERTSAGNVFLDDECVDGERFVPPERRSVGLVFQQFALFPHLDVEQNIAFGLKQRDGARVDSLIELTGLSAQRKKRPEQLSGGEQQRVALARALAPKPRAVLLDEPFANLDAQLRRRVRDEVRAILRAEGATAVLVTHDREEAFDLADRIALMRAGEVLQVDAPEALYRHPHSVEVAELCGEGSAVPSGIFGDEAIFVRPEGIELADDGARATVTGCCFLGAEHLVTLRIEDTVVLMRKSAETPALQPDQDVRVRLVEGRNPIIRRERS